MALLESWAFKSWHFHRKATTWSKSFSKKSTEPPSKWSKTSLCSPNFPFFGYLRLASSKASPRIQENCTSKGPPHWGTCPSLGTRLSKVIRTRRDRSRSLLSTPSSSNSTSTTQQIPNVLAIIWHNSHPRKVGTLIWLTLNCELLVGTWLQCMGISPMCKVCPNEVLESLQHYLFQCVKAKHTWEAYLRIWRKWGAPDDVAFS